MKRKGYCIESDRGFPVGELNGYYTDDSAAERVEYIAREDPNELPCQDVCKLYDPDDRPVGWFSFITNKFVFRPGRG